VDAQKAKLPANFQPHRDSGASANGALGTESERYSSHQAATGGNPGSPRDLRLVQAMDREKSSGHDETQALAVARAEEELLKKFQMMKQKVQRSPTGMEQAPDAHPVSAPPKVTGPVFNFGSNEDEQTTPKRSREPTSPEEASDGAHKRQRVQKSAAALTDELGKMLDEMIAKFTDTKSNNKKVVRHVTQATIDSLHAMKKLQSEISATLDEPRARGQTASATQQTTPSLVAPRQEGIERTHTGAGNPGRDPPRNPPWQQVIRKTKKGKGGTERESVRGHALQF